MVINGKSSGRVKFISYTGKYPNLCSGVLTLEIDGKECKFGHNSDYSHYDHNLKKWVYTDEDSGNPNHDAFWESGGNCGFRNNYEEYVNTGEWRIIASDLPEEFRELAGEIDAVFNENVPYGCCGGCL